MKFKNIKNKPNKIETNYKKREVNKIKIKIKQVKYISK